MPDRDRDRDGLWRAHRPAAPTLDLAAGVVRVEERIVEVSKKDSPTGQRMIVKAYPKDNKPRTLRISPALAQVLADRWACPGFC